MKKIIFASILSVAIFGANDACFAKKKKKEIFRIYSPYAIEQQKLADEQKAAEIAKKQAAEVAEKEAEVAENVTVIVDENAEKEAVGIEPTAKEVEPVEVKKTPEKSPVAQKKEEDKRVSQEIKDKKINDNLSVETDLDRYQNIFDNFKPNYKPREDKKTSEKVQNTNHDFSEPQ